VERGFVRGGGVLGGRGRAGEVEGGGGGAEGRGGGGGGGGMFPNVGGRLLPVEGGRVRENPRRGGRGQLEVLVGGHGLDGVLFYFVVVSTSYSFFSLFVSKNKSILCSQRRKNDLPERTRNEEKSQCAEKIKHGTPGTHHEKNLEIFSGFSAELRGCATWHHPTGHTATWHQHRAKLHPGERMTRGGTKRKRKTPRAAGRRSPRGNALLRRRGTHALGD